MENGQAGEALRSGASNSAGLHAHLFFNHVVEFPQHVQNVLALKHESVETPLFEVFSDNAFMVFNKLVPYHPRFAICHIPSTMNN
jgi:hypothetical protein